MLTSPHPQQMTLRVVLAGLAASAPVALSVGKDLPVDVRGVLENKGIKYEVKSDAAVPRRTWLRTLRPRFAHWLVLRWKAPVSATSVTT